MENIFQFMAVTRGGPIGLNAASPVVEDIRVALVHATIPDQLMVAEAVGALEKLSKGGNVIQKNVKVIDYEQSPFIFAVRRA